MIPDENDEDCEVKPDGSRVCTKKKKSAPKYGQIKSLRCEKNERTQKLLCNIRTESSQTPEV